MKAIQALLSGTREGFRLVVAWVTGFLSFGLLSGLSERAILYFEPWKSNNVAHSEAELVPLFCLIGLGILALVAALIFEGLDAKSIR
jgi:hypothetical protein